MPFVVGGFTPEAVVRAASATATAAQTRLVVANQNYLGPFSAVEDFIFKRNPTRVDVDRQSTHVEVPIAQDDNGPTSSANRFEWVSNKPRTIHVEFTLHTTGDDDVSADLRRLDALMEKDPRTGEPPDLIFTHGPRSWLCRIDGCQLKDKQRYTPDLRPQHYDVTLTLRIKRQVK